MMKRVTVDNLTDQTGTPHPRPLLYCRQCGAENSANRGDYFWLPSGHVFKCCGVNMALVTKQTVYNVVEG